MSASLDVITLDNGLRIVADPMPAIETAAVGVWVDIGARHESLDQHGISHLLEHMAFKGTTSRSARCIAEAIENVGGYLNAYTSREQTAYYARVLKDDVPLAIDLLSDILTNSTFEAEELAREREVIIAEISDALDTPDDLIFDHLQAAMYRDQVIGRTILGTPDSVRSIPSAALRSYMDQHYGAGQMVLVGSGAVDPKAIEDLAAKAFGDRPRGAARAYPAAAFTPGERREVRPLEQAHVALAFEGVGHHQADAYAAQVYATILGGGMSSRLFQEAREKRGLCYAIYAFASPLVDGGAMGVYAGSAAKDVKDLLSVIAEQMSALEHQPQAAEIARAKAQLKAGLLMGLESPSQRIEQIARQVLIFGRPLSAAEMIAKVDAVDEAAIGRIGATARISPPVFAALGPIKGLEPYDKIARRFAA